MYSLPQHLLSFAFIVLFSSATFAKETDTTHPVTKSPVVKNPSAKTTAPQNTIAVIHTNKGTITLDLNSEKAPVTVKNFIAYAKSSFYNGTIFHRVIEHFMIQGGGFTKDMAQKTPKAPIINESDNGLSNDRWTIAMARTQNPNSATSQFFINTKSNSSLNAAYGKPGYAVFGIVTGGQQVVKTIEKSATTRVGRYSDVPVEAIIIESIEIK